MQFTSESPHDQILVKKNGFLVKKLGGIGEGIDNL